MVFQAGFGPIFLGRVFVLGIFTVFTVDPLGHVHTEPFTWNHVETRDKRKAELRNVRLGGGRETGTERVFGTCFGTPQHTPPTRGGVVFWLTTIADVT